MRVVNDTSGIIIENSKVMLQIGASITDDSKGVIYNRNMFIVQAPSHDEKFQTLKWCTKVMALFLTYFK